MELDSGHDRPRVRPTARRRPAGAPRLRPGTPLTVEPLEVYERNGDGHTLSRHCGSSPAVESERLARHRELPATGSFTDVATAQRAVEACVAANREQVVSWRAGQRLRLVVDHHLDEVIGGVLRRSRWAAGDRLPLPASELRVVLRRNPAYPSGFAVLTAYPVRHDPPQHPLPPPPLPGNLPVSDTPGMRGDRDAPLRRRLRGDRFASQASVFNDRAAARAAVATALHAAGADLDDWLLCAHRPRLSVDAWIGSFLGVVLTRDAYRRRRGSVAAHSVHVVLHRSQCRPWGFRVAAAYPRLP